MQFLVYLTAQEISDLDCPTISPIWAKRAITAKVAVQCGQNMIRLTIRGMTWPQAKALMRGYPGELNPPGYHVPPYTYPLPYDILRHYQV